MKKTLLITSRYTSANTKVAIDIVRSCIEKMPLICVGRGEKSSVVQIDDVTCYYNVYSKSYDWSLRSRKHGRLSYFYKILNSIYCRFYNLFSDKYVLSEEECIYRECLELVKNNDLKYIFSVSNPLYSHRIAIRILKQYPQLKWIPIWLDAYSNARGEGDGFIYNRKKELEEYVLTHAEAVYSLPETFVGNSLYPYYSGKIKIIGLPYIKDREVKQRNKDIIYAGSFVKGLRDPEPVFDSLLRTLENIDEDIMFHFYINNPEMYHRYEKLSKGRIRMHGYVNREELDALLSNCFMLLNVGNRDSVQVPSKVLEYISYRKPTLYFYYNSNDPSFKYYNDYPNTCLIDLNEDAHITCKLIEDFMSAKHTSIDYKTLMSSAILCQNTEGYVKNTILL